MNGFTLIQNVEKRFEDADMEIADIGFTADGDMVTVELPLRGKELHEKRLDINSKDHDAVQTVVDFIMTNYISK